MRSTLKRRLLTFGHVWVVLAVLVPEPFSGRVWALPILFRLFRRTQADCQTRLGLPIRPWYRTKRTVAFADILRLAQRTLSSADWTDPRLLLANLRDSTPPPQVQVA